MTNLVEIPVSKSEDLLEKQLLGAMMRWPDVLDDFFVDVEWFDVQDHRDVFVKISKTFWQADVAAPSLVSAGESAKFSQLVFECWGECFASKLSFDFWLQKLREIWARRVLMQMGQGLLNPDSDDVLEKLDLAHKYLEKVTAVQDEDVVYTPAEYLPAYVDQMAEGDAFMATSWRRLNRIIGGFRPSGLYVIGGRPGQGKTTVLLQAAWDLAKAGKKVLFVSLEMPVKQLQHRILAQSLGLDVSHIADDLLDYEVMNADGSHIWARDLVRQARTVLNDNLLMSAPSEITPTRLRSLLKKQIRSGGVDAVFVDYLQIADDDSKHSSRNDEVRAVSGKFKKIAKQFDLPLITAVQLNRDVESRVKGKPKLTDISESDKIGMDADVAVMIHRDFREGDNPDGQGSDLYLLVVKNRHGQTGAARFVAQDGFSRIVEQ
jgi:replicative DNA helicase